MKMMMMMMKSADINWTTDFYSPWAHIIEQCAMQPA